MRVLAILAALSLGACGSVPKPEPVIQTQVVKVEVPVSCVPNDYTAAAVQDTEAALLAAGDPALRMGMVYGNWAIDRAFLDRDEKIIDACRKAAPAK